MVKNMQQREIGKTKLKIDTLGLGCAPLGGNFVDLSYSQGAELVNAALDAGISYFDTAPWYGFGRSERVVGDQLRNKDIIISSIKGASSTLIESTPSTKLTETILK